MKARKWGKAPTKHAAAVKPSLKKTPTKPAVHSMQQLRVLQAGFAGKARGSVCKVVSVERDTVTIAGGKKAALSTHGKVWEWVQV